MTTSIVFRVLSNPLTIPNPPAAAPAEVSAKFSLLTAFAKSLVYGGLGLAGVLAVLFVVLGGLSGHGRMSEKGEATLVKVIMGAAGVGLIPVVLNFVL